MARKNIPPDHLPTLTAIGDKLKSLREAKGQTLHTVAGKLGMSRNVIAQMEKGQVYFQLSKLLTLLDHYNQDHLDFFRDL